MSVTFSVINSPVRSIPRPCWCLVKNRPYSICMDCNGSGETSTEVPVTSMQMTQQNAEAILRLVLTQNPGSYGEVSIENVPRLRRSIMRAMNQKSIRALEYRKSNYACVNKSVGIDDAYLMERLKELDTICVLAQELNETLVWG